MNKLLIGLTVAFSILFMAGTADAHHGGKHHHRFYGPPPGSMHGLPYGVRTYGVPYQPYYGPIYGPRYYYGPRRYYGPRYRGRRYYRPRYRRGGSLYLRFPYGSIGLGW